jgi:hypothetical protein
MDIVRRREASIATGAKENPSDPAFVQSLIDLHDESKQVHTPLSRDCGSQSSCSLCAIVVTCFWQLVTTEFRSNSLFQKALKDAFEVFVNKEVNSKHTNAELISSYCDRALKGGGCVGGVLPAACLLPLA